MNFALLAPLGLAALTALVIPILIHLVRRIELRTTEFAALRWISERIRPQRRIRFERPWLLLLRLLLLALVALLLARPVLDEPSLAKRGWVVVAPGADLGAARAEVSSTGADWRWLALGFPPIEMSPPSGSIPVASLLREIDSDLPRETALTVIVPAELAGLDGERPVLSRNVDWHVVPGTMPVVNASDGSEPITLAVRYAPASELALRYIRAAVDAWNARDPGRYTLDAREDSASVGDSARWLIWLGSDPPSSVDEWIDRGGTAVVENRPNGAGVPVWRDAQARVLARVQPHGRGRVVALSGAFSPASLPALLDADFPSQLQNLLREAHAALTRAPADAMRPVAGADATTTAAISHSAKPLDAWLALLIAALFLLERVVATRERAPV
ncbi:MAG: BatA domain-containing protein [Rhodanobacteraceae bacterium]